MSLTWLDRNYVKHLYILSFGYYIKERKGHFTQVKPEAVFDKELLPSEEEQDALLQRYEKVVFGYSYGMMGFYFLLALKTLTNFKTSKLGKVCRVWLGGILFMPSIGLAGLLGTKFHANWIIQLDENDAVQSERLK